MYTLGNVDFLLFSESELSAVTYFWWRQCQSLEPSYVFGVILRVRMESAMAFTDGERSITRTSFGLP